MELNEFQRLAQETDRVPLTSEAVHPDPAILVPLLGMAGEVGTLSAEYKKIIRDEPVREDFRERAGEELGDVLWYVANLAFKFDLDLDEVARKNLEKTESRWRPTPQAMYSLYDSEFPSGEQLPRSMEIDIVEVEKGGGHVVEMWSLNERLGDDLTDNAYVDDDYRFHDVFHLALMAKLGWSPVLRHLMRRKRKSNSQIDEVEDGGRARVIEEGIVAFVWSHAVGRRFLEGVETIDFDVLKTIKSLTTGLEVHSRGYADWEEAIFDGYEVFRKVRIARGGHISLNLVDRRITFTNQPTHVR